MSDKERFIKIVSWLVTSHKEYNSGEEWRLALIRLLFELLLESDEMPFPAPSKEELKEAMKTCEYVERFRDMTEEEYIQYRKVNE